MTDSYVVEGEPHYGDPHKIGGNVIYLNKKNGDFRDLPSVVKHLMQQAV
jgi:hypothetical protein